MDFIHLCLICSSLSVPCLFLQYPVRVAQCEAATNEIKKRHPEVDLLRDVFPEQVIICSHVVLVSVV